MKKLTLGQIKDKFIGESGTAVREQYEFDLRMEVVGEMIKMARKKRRLTQKELGELIGVQKAQISKLENGSKNVTIATILKVFDALKANLKFKIELLDVELSL